MTKIILYCIAIALAWLPYSAAGRQQLHLNSNCGQKPVAYHDVRVIDNRLPNAPLGYVQTGAFNRLKAVEFEGSLADSLARFFTNGYARSTESRTLVLVLNELFLSEWTTGMSEEATLRMSIRLFLQSEGDNYRELATLDSVYSFKSMDVTQRLLRTVNEELCWLAQHTVSVRPHTGHVYAFESLRYLDSLELPALPVFTQAPVAGVYKDYAHFKNNTPDEPMTIVMDTARSGEIRPFKVTKDRKGREQRTSYLGTQEIYAVSDGVHLYRLAEGGYHEITISGSGLYYERRVQLSNNGAMWGAVIGGIPGAVIGTAIAHGYVHRCRFRINPRTGRSSPVAILD